MRKVYEALEDLRAAAETAESECESRASEARKPVVTGYRITSVSVRDTGDSSNFACEVYGDVYTDHGHKTQCIIWIVKAANVVGAAAESVEYWKLNHIPGVPRANK